jgi:hypothetical protein
VTVDELLQALVAIGELGVIIAATTLACTTVRLYLTLEQLIRERADDEKTRK